VSIRFFVPFRRFFKLLVEHAVSEDATVRKGRKTEGTVGVDVEVSFRVVKFCALFYLSSFKT
jgi:hypothetical protein